MWFLRLKDLFVPSDDEIELMIKSLREVSDKKSKPDVECCDPRHSKRDRDTVGE